MAVFCPIIQKGNSDFGAISSRNACGFPLDHPTPKDTPEKLSATLEGS
jgi:hypothetical protein